MTSGEIYRTQIKNLKFSMGNAIYEKSDGGMVHVIMIYAIF